MIQNRIDGFVTLHGLVLIFLLGAVYQGTFLAIESTQFVVLSTEFNHDLYFLGVLAGAISIHRHLSVNAKRYGQLDIREALSLTARQLMRLMLMVLAITFVTKDTSVSRAFIAVFTGVSAVILLLANFFVPRLLAFLFVRDSIQRTLLAVSSTDSLQVRLSLDKYAELGVHLVGYVSDAPIDRDYKLTWLGKPEEMEAIAVRKSVDQVLIDQAMMNESRGRGLIEGCERLGCRVRTFVHISAMLPSPTAEFERGGDYAFGTITPEPLDNPVNRVAKRILDIVISLPVVMFVLPPVLLVTAIIQRKQSPGPVLYFQWRSGLNRRRFLIYKIRTMHIAANLTTAQQATKADSRIYPFGRFLRRTSLDELPQFFNVLRGEMSVSGPRPHLIEHDEIFASTIGTYRKRHFVKPGITGLAQSNGCRGETSATIAIIDRVRYDMLYIEKWSLLMDVKIIINTARQVLFPPSSAY
jgi:exopolysaccharide biosynthesis polyprenyl glycosylphosphotransferase